LTQIIFKVRRDGIDAVHNVSRLGVALNQKGVLYHDDDDDDEDAAKDHGQQA
jgi:hypothetical protein